MAKRGRPSLPRKGDTVEVWRETPDRRLRWFQTTALGPDKLELPGGEVIPRPRFKQHWRIVRAPEPPPPPVPARPREFWHIVRWEDEHGRRFATPRTADSKKALDTAKAKIRAGFQDVSVAIAAMTITEIEVERALREERAKRLNRGLEPLAKPTLLQQMIEAHRNAKSSGSSVGGKDPSRSDTSGD